MLNLCIQVSMINLIVISINHFLEWYMYQDISVIYVK